MIRKKDKQTNNYTVECVCGIEFNARGDNSTLTTDSKGKIFLQWICPSCAQIYVEKPNKVIVLEHKEDQAEIDLQLATVSSEDLKDVEEIKEK